MKILITSFPFGHHNTNAIDMLNKHTLYITPYTRQSTKEEIKNLVSEFNPDAIIAGTERYDSEVLDLCCNLKLISRVGIGLDSIDLEECKKRNILVTNTPDAPVNAVAELVIGQIINASRRIQDADKQLRKGIWTKYIGKDLTDCCIGVIGYGKIGSSVVRKLEALGAGAILTHDINKPSPYKTDKDGLLQYSDIVTIHMPFDRQNENYITKKDLSKMKKDSILINTSRGGIVNEKDLYDWLSENKNAVAVIDTFVEEPYNGNLIQLENCYVTPHFGSFNSKSRTLMEEGAAREVLKLADLTNTKLTDENKYNYLQH